MTTQTMNVFGMSCAVCARAIETAVGKLPFVDFVSVNLAANTMSVSFDETRGNIEDICSAVSKIGFSAEVKSFARDAEQSAKKALQELKDSRKRLSVALFFGAILFYFAMAPMLFGAGALPNVLSPAHPLRYALVQLLLLIPIIVVGRKFYISGFSALVRKSPNMDSLVAIGTSSAILYSFYGLIRIALGDSHAVHNLYFESGGMILALIMLGKHLELRAKQKTNTAVQKLMQLAPETVHLLVDGVETESPIENVRVGDLLIVRPGERIPVDGVLVEGSAAIDESMLTGESFPVDKTVEDAVTGGCINLNSIITVRVTRIGADTTLSQIIRLVTEAQGSKAPISKLADVVSGYFVPAVIAVAVFAALLWAMVEKPISFVLTVFISVLVISCPCALGLATPVAIMTGTGKGASLGILFKNGEALESAHHITHAVFDKTGTITLGKPQVTDVFPIGCNADTLLRFAASVEHGSEHPLASAITNHASEQNLTLLPISDFRAHSGFGVSAVCDNAEILIGNAEFLAQAEIDLSASESTANNLAACGKTPMFVAKNKTLLGIIAVSDPIKPTSARAIEILHAMNIQTVMLTGDNETTAQAVAKQVGVTRVVAGVRPENKADEIQRLKELGFRVAMVGDGINDAPALAAADVGIAIASGTDIAMESADVVLMHNDLEDVPRAIRLSHRVIRNIKQNLFWAFGYNILGIPIAAGVLTLFGGPLLSPMIGAFAMSLSSISVVTNALRLNFVNLEK